MHLGCLIDAPPHAVTPCSRRDLASNLGEAAFVLSEISLSGSESDLFEPTETLKGVPLRPYLRRLRSFHAASWPAAARSIRSSSPGPSVRAVISNRMPF